MKLKDLMPRTLTLLVLVPVVLAGGLSVAVSIYLLNTNLSDYLQRRTKSELKLASSIALEICDENFDDLLTIRMANDSAMVQTMKNDSLVQILDLPSRFSLMHFLVVENGQEVVGSTIEGLSRKKLQSMPPPEGEIFEMELEGGRALAYGRYFPFFRWHLVSFSFADEFFLPLIAGRRAVYLSLMFVVAVFVGTLLAVFSFAVNRPLTRLVDASSEVARGRFKTVSTSRRDEIGRLMNSFNSMVSELEKTRREQEEMLEKLSESERRVKNSLKEKEVLLQEIHHRVKNNLNIVVSLLNLQADYIHSVEDAERALEVSRSRVFSMALVHERLYKSENFSQIGMREYIEAVVEELSSLYGYDRDISVHMDLEDAELDITLAVPFGLILNELVTNALLHAFPEGSSGRIDIRFSCGSADVCEMEIEDNGVGITQVQESEEEGHLGLTLIRLLASQIGAEMTIDSDHGTRIRIRIPRSQ